MRGGHREGWSLHGDITDVRISWMEGEIGIATELMNLWYVFWLTGRFSGNLENVISRVSSQVRRIRAVRERLEA